MTREQILALAKQYSQYPDTKEMTLRGESIVEFAEALLKADWEAYRKAALSQAGD